MKRPNIIVVPCYNEESRLHIGEFRDFAGADPQTGFLFVDDGSTDGTTALLRESCTGEIHGLRYRALNSNCGKAEAVRQGMLEAIERGASSVGYWDADLASPLVELRTMLDILDSNKALHGVLGSRVRLLGRSITRRPLRHYLGRIFATTVSMGLRMPVYDTQCGAKVFRVSEALQASLARPFHSRWIFDVELLLRLQNEWTRDAEDCLEEYPLRTWKDVDGSKLRPRDAMRIVRDFARIWSHRRQDSQPS